MHEPTLRFAGRAIVLAIAALTIAGCSTTASNAIAAQRLDALFTGLHERGLFDGAVVAGRGGEIVWEKAFGYADVEAAARFTTDTPVDGGSLAKTFTAALLLTLKSEGTIDLDAPVQRLLPQLPYPDITLRHLLSHSSGLPSDYGYFDPYLTPDSVRTTEILLDVIASRKPALAFPPGTAFEYNSIGWDLAALAASRAAGETYETLLRKRFFTPLGFTSAFLRPGRFREFPGIRTRGYKRDGAKIEPNEVFDLEAFHGGSNIYLSARDLHRWNTSYFTTALMTPGVLAESLEFPRINHALSGLTLGSWYKGNGGAEWWYPGHLQGFHSVIYRDLTTQTSITYVSNNTIASWLQHGIIRAVNTILAGRNPQPLSPPPASVVRKEEYPALAGSWVLDDEEVVSTHYSDGRLMMGRDGVSYQMFQIDSQAFYVPGLDFIVGFSTGGAAPARMYVSSNLTERWAKIRH